MLTIRNVVYVVLIVNDVAEEKEIMLTQICAHESDVKVRDNEHAAANTPFPQTLDHCSS